MPKNADIWKQIEVWVRRWYALRVSDKRTIRSELMMEISTDYHEEIWSLLKRRPIRSFIYEIIDEWDDDFDKERWEAKGNRQEQTAVIFKYTGKFIDKLKSMYKCATKDCNELYDSYCNKCNNSVCEQHQITMKRKRVAYCPKHIQEGIDHHKSMEKHYAKNPASNISGLPIQLSLYKKLAEESGIKIDTTHVVYLDDD